MKRIYISGPMSNMAALNFPAFNHAAAILRAAGYEAINPAEINPDPTAKWQDCMFRDLAELDTCDAILMLEGWENSPGAQIEKLWAQRTGKAIWAPTVLGCIEAQLMNEELT